MGVMNLPNSHEILKSYDNLPMIDGSGKKAYPFQGPHIWYDTRDHLHGGTGFVTRSAGSPTTIISTGSLPNTGSVSGFDLDISQKSFWDATYSIDFYQKQGEVSNFVVPQTEFVDLFGNNLLSKGPMFACFITSDISTKDSVLLYSAGNIYGNATMQFYFYPKLTLEAAGSLTARTSLELEVVGTGGAITDFSYEFDSFYPFPDISGAYYGDLFPGKDADYSDSPWNNYFDGKIFGELLDFEHGVLDTHIAGVWGTDSIHHGVPPGLAVFGPRDEFWGLGAASFSLREDTINASSTGFGKKSVLEACYQSDDNYGYEIYLDDFIKYGSLPVEGQFWEGIRAWGLFSGVPTKADLAAILASVGL